MTTEALSFFEIVRRQDDRDPCCIESAEEFVHPMPEFEIDSSRRLIEYEKMGIMDECASNHEATLHTTGECTSLHISLVPEPESLQVFLDIGSCFFS